MCVVIDQNTEVTASVETTLRHSDLSPELEFITTSHSLVPILQEKKPHILFSPQVRSNKLRAWMDMLQRHSPDTLLVWISRDHWQGLTSWHMGVESCTLPLADSDYFSQYVDFLLHYSTVKQEFRHCKHLLGVAELRCHWLVDYSWEPIAYIGKGMHLYANHAYISVFGFESLAEARSVPVEYLVDVTERPTFAAMTQAAGSSNKPSSRLLTTLRTLQGTPLRAEIRFIPAVLKSQRCLQLHVKPLDRQPYNASLQKRAENPWEQHKTNATQATGIEQLISPATSKALAKIQPIYSKAKRLFKNEPQLFFAEPGFKQANGKITPFEQLVNSLHQSDGRFWLDYWNLGQTLRKLVSQVPKHPGYLILVSIGGAIFNNDQSQKRLLALLQAHAQAAKNLVIALPYRDCITHHAQLGNLLKLFKAAGFAIAIDGLLIDSHTLPLVRAVKPKLVRIDASLGMTAGASVTTKEQAQLQQLITQLSDLDIKVIVSGINEVALLTRLLATPATYLQGTMLDST